MANKKDNIIYWIATGLLCAMAIMSAGMYIFNNQMVREMFSSLGYPTYIIYPLAALKTLGVISILSKKSKMLKEWAYAGFFFTFSLAISAHLVAQDGEFMGAAFALLLLIVSYVYDKKIFAK